VYDCPCPLIWKVAELKPTGIEGNVTFISVGEQLTISNVLPAARLAKFAVFIAAFEQNKMVSLSIGGVDMVAPVSTILSVIALIPSAPLGPCGPCKLTGVSVSSRTSTPAAELLFKEFRRETKQLQYQLKPQYLQF
jgi:hypothetical protein